LSHPLAGKVGCALFGHIATLTSAIKSFWLGKSYTQAYSGQFWWLVRAELCHNGPQKWKLQNTVSASFKSQTFPLHKILSLNVKTCVTIKQTAQNVTLEKETAKVCDKW